MALRAACEVVEQNGLSSEGATVLQDSTNLLVQFPSADVVARVATTTARIRPGLEWLRREVEVTRYLADRGAPVVTPERAIPAGPHEHLGFAMSFWERVHASDARPDPSASGRALALCHEILREIELELPELAPLSESDRLITTLAGEGAVSPEDAALLTDTLCRLHEALSELDEPKQALHGDAHLTNVMTTASGPIWTDWEDTFRGPIGWDLACLVASARVLGREPARAQAALEAHGPQDLGSLDTWIEARTLYAYLWSVEIRLALGLQLSENDPRLAWLRQRK